ncbi:MAG: PadR family transcriptional regulator [Gemmatimonadetes bacterium]|nr:PadR family transcriptional regulator [Gemmatimonadota bacterium]
MTNKRDYLGEFEYVVLLAVMRLGEDAYGVTIRREIEARTDRDVSLGAIYPTLHRLEDKGLVSSYTGEPTATRGGRSKRHFRLEAKGQVALKRSRDMISALWQGFETDPGSGHQR